MLNTRADRIQHTPSSAIEAGDVVVVGELVCFAPDAIAAGELGTLYTEGVYLMPRTSFQLGGIPAGAVVYWKESEKGIVIKPQGSANKRCGWAIEGSPQGPTPILVLFGR